MDQAEWMKLAWMSYGEKEISGRVDNLAIMKFYKDVGHEGVRHDEVAWCAAFLGSCLERAGIKSTGSLMARSYLDWGRALNEPRPGAIAVLRRGRNTALGHVGFIVRATAKTLYLLGGNQSDQVKISAYARSRLLGIRWPVSANDGQAEPATTHAAPAGRGAAGGAGSGVFEAALVHVLAMEGGYDDDPHDPGGATNFGITIGDFARARKVALKSNNLAAMKRKLKAIKPKEVRGIYHSRYWLRASCHKLPSALATMHFDCAVNQGVRQASLFLQKAVGADVDGEIGPQTLAATDQVAQNETALTDALEHYAQLRRAQYRGLGHFWRFGRGWLRRVEQTLALAQSHVASSVEEAFTKNGASARKGGFSEERNRNSNSGSDSNTRSNSNINKQGSNMTTTVQKSTKTKWWGESMTIWGTIVTAASTILPVLAPLIGLDITPELVTQLGEQVIQIIKLAGGIVGIVMTIYGRMRATTRLVRQEVKLMM